MANLSNINNKFLVTTGGNVLIGQTTAVGSSIFQVTGTVQVNGSNVTVIKDSDPSLTVSDTDTNYRGTMRFNTTSNVLEFVTRYASTYYTNNLVLDRGNVGIGVTPASSFGFSKTLEIQGAADAEINISQSNNSKDWSLGITNGANYQQTTSGQAYVWESGGTERMRILSNGNLAFNAASNLNSSNFQISTNSGLGANVDVFIANTSGVPYVNSATTTQLSMGFLSGVANYVGTGQRLGALQFFGQANDAGYGGASIKAVVTTGGNVNRSSHAVDLTFETMAAGSLGNTEKMRINSNGNVGIKNTTPYSLLDVNGVITNRAASEDPNFTVNVVGMSTIGAGSLQFTQGFAGTSAAGDTVVFRYNAVSWKSWSLDYTFAAANGGLVKGTIGGYNNNSGGGSNGFVKNDTGCTVVATNSGQNVIVTFTANFGIHPMCDMRYSQGGGDGFPRADRASLTFNS